MARLITGGFDTGSVNAEGPNGGTTGAPVLETVIVHTPYGSTPGSMKVNAAQGAQNVAFTASALGTTYFYRVYIYIATYPAAAVSILSDNRHSLQLDPTGHLRLTGTGLLGTGTTVIPLNTWTLVEMSSLIVSGTGDACAARINGAAELSFTNTNASDSAPANLVLGVGAANAQGIVIYFDDYAANDSTGAADTSWCGPGGSVFLKALSDNARDTNWTAGAGATTGLFDAVDNTPPVAVADGSATNTSQIRNPASDTTGNYDVNVQSYNTAGIPAGVALIRAQAFASVGVSSTTSPPNVALRVLSNPTDSERVAGANPGAVAGTFQSGWLGRWGNSVAASAATRGTSPVARVGKRTATTTVLDVAILGVYVEVMPPSFATDVVTISDTATRSGASQRTGTDALSVSDAAVRVESGARAAADTVAVSDIAARVKGGSRTTVDVVAFTDSATVSTRTSRTAADGLTISDLASRIGTQSRTAADTVAIADAASRLLTPRRAVSDAIALSDQATVGAATRHRTTADALAVADSTGRLSSGARTASDTLTLSDAARAFITHVVRITGAAFAKTRTAGESQSQTRITGRANTKTSTTGRQK